MTATDSPRTGAIRGEVEQAAKKARKKWKETVPFRNRAEGGCRNATTAADIGTPGEKRRDIRRRRVGRAIGWRCFQSPLWTSADYDAGSVPTHKFAEKG
jgi:hypothetical protein